MTAGAFRSILLPSGGASALAAVLSPGHNLPLQAIRPPQQLNSSSILLLDAARSGGGEALDQIHRPLDDIRQAGLQCVTLP